MESQWAKRGDFKELIGRCDNQGVCDGDDGDVGGVCAVLSEQTSALAERVAGGFHVVDEPDVPAGQVAWATGECVADVVTALLLCVQAGLGLGGAGASEDGCVGPIARGGETFGDERGLIVSASPTAQAVQRYGDDDVALVLWRDDLRELVGKPRRPVPGLVELHLQDPGFDGVCVGGEARE